jgi:small subunit ribosomal protein S6
MTKSAPTYDLVLLLDPQTDGGAREKILADTRTAVEAKAELVRHDEWGERPLAYPIDRKTSAEYHLYQFRGGGAELLDGLDRTLRITDGVLRFRLIKLKAGVPEAPDMRASSSPSARPADSEPPAAAAEPPAQEELAGVASSPQGEAS